MVTWVIVDRAQDRSPEQLITEQQLVGLGREERQQTLAAETADGRCTQSTAIVSDSGDTVGRIIHRVVQRQRGDVDARLDGLTHIGIDELSYRRHHEYVTVVVDHKRGQVVCDVRGLGRAARLGQGGSGSARGVRRRGSTANSLRILPNLFQDEYRAWYVDFVAEVARVPRRAEALERCRELVTSPSYAALGRAVTEGTEHGQRIVEFMGAFGAVRRWTDVLALRVDDPVGAAPLPRPLANMSNAPHGHQARTCGQ